MPGNINALGESAAAAEALPSDVSDDGLSLEALSRTYARMMGRATDPFAPAPEQGALSDQAVRDTQNDSETGGETDAPSNGESASAEKDLEDESADDIPADDACEITPASILEAMLFVGHPDNEPLTSREVAALMRGVSPREIDELVRELNRGYAEDESVYQIVSAGAGYRLELREAYGGLRDKFYGRIREARLTQAAIDILAIVAYNQPISRRQVDQIREQPSGGILSTLVRRKLLRLERTADQPKEAIYHTAERFLDLFGLESIKELPRSQELDSFE